MLILFLMPAHSVSSMNRVCDLISMSCSRSNCRRTRPFMDEMESESRACSLSTDWLISVTSSTSLYCTASLQSSTLGLPVRFSSRVSLSFSGASFSAIVLFKRSMLISTSLICASTWMNHIYIYSTLYYIIDPVCPTHYITTSISTLDRWSSSFSLASRVSEMRLSSEMSVHSFCLNMSLHVD